jgi:hypothetical protein
MQDSGSWMRRRWPLWAAVAMATATAPACGGVPAEPAETETAQAAALQGANGISADLVMDSQWGQGYCARVVLANHHPSATTGTWSVALDLGAATTFTTWDGVFSGNTGRVTVGPQPYNAAIPPSGTAAFGLCASIPTPGLRPILVSVTSDLPPPGAAAVTEYKLPAAVDPLVSPDFAVELWASFYRPATLTAGRRYPLLVFMHGNHPTCGTGANPRRDDNNMYALTGTCPANYVVVPSHRGYDYIAQDLAARGYFVVSINTNRGVNGGAATTDDAFIIGPRGRLLLRHLERLSRWNAGTEATPSALGVSLLDRIDFSQVGLMGHSRGGEGVRFAYNEYRRSGSPWPALIGAAVSFRGVFEIGPTDELVGGQSINAAGTPWNVILPACDWDLPDLPGVRVFDRMLKIAEPTPTFKSFYHVWGADHNYYNSEWQIADANSGGIQGCIDHQPLFDPAQFGSPAQRETGRFAAVAFFTANVGVQRDPPANALFDSAFPLTVPYRVNRGYHPGGDQTASLVLEDFINASGTSSYGLPNQTGGTITVDHNQASGHDPSLRAAFIHDIAPSGSTFFQSNWAPVGQGFNLTAYRYLDLRVDRSFTSDPAPVAFRIQLVNRDDTRSSAVSSDQFVEIVPPPRGAATLHTARIPLASFSGAQLASVRAVRLIFDGAFPGGGGLFVANIRASIATTAVPPATAPVAAGGAAPTAATTATSAATSATAATADPARITAGNTIQSVKSVGAAIEIALESEHFFDLRARNLVLSVGAAQTTRARHPDGDLHRVRFLLARDTFDRLAQGAPISVQYGTGASTVWDFGALDKASLDR